MAETESLRNERPSLKRWHKIALGIFGVLFASILVLGLLRIAYQGRFLPGATLYGVPVSGLTEASARDLVERETNQYIESSTIIVNSSEAQTTKVSIPASEVELNYNIGSDLTSIYQYGRRGQIFEQLGSQLGLMLGLANLPTGSVSYNPTKLYAILQPVDASLSTSTVNASYAATNNQLSINPEKQGQRVDWARFLSDYEGLVLSRQRGAATVSAYTQPATVTQEILATKRSALTPFLEKPLVLTFEKKTWNVGSEALVSWLSYTSYAGPVRSEILANYYGFERRDLSSVGFDTAKIKAYLQTIAPGVNRPAKDAVLTISGDRASVFQQSQDGRAIDLDVCTDYFR
jgi:vancomycin resistance protein YoaR